MKKQNETPQKLHQQYVRLLETSNKKLDDKILELTLFNKIANAFESAAYDRFNISGFLFDLLKKREGMELLAIFFQDGTKKFLIFASDKKISPEYKNQFLAKILNKFNQIAQSSLVPQEVSIVDIHGSDFSNQEISGCELFLNPLVTLDSPVGLMAFGFPSGKKWMLDTEKFLSTIAIQIALFVENDRVRQAIVHEHNKLEAVNKELEQFAYIASHDLQEPLRMITSYLLLLQKRYQGKLSTDADEFIGYAVGGATHLSRLIRDLLLYSRVDTQRKEFSLVDCEAILSQSLMNLEVAIQESGAKVTHDPLPTLKGDYVQLVQLFQNLIGNALKYHSDRSPQIHISVGKKENEWVFSVQDNGIGIDKKYFDQIFVIFRRLHRDEKYQGTGIGLAICKKIVERHGGRIWVDSQVGQGTTFYFAIPS